MRGVGRTAGMGRPDRDKIPLPMRCCDYSKVGSEPKASNAAERMGSCEPRFAGIDVFNVDTLRELVFTSRGCVGAHKKRTFGHLRNEYDLQRYALTLTDP